jgi:hypothetical protein
MPRNSGPWEKKKKRLHKKEEKGFTEAFSAAHNFELPGSLPSDAYWMLALNGAPVAAQNAIALFGTLCLSRSVSFLDLFLSFFFASGSVCACFFREVFFFFFLVKQRVREMAPIAVGDKIPDGTLFYLNSDGKPTAFPVYESLKGKKVVLVAAPGAFTPTCRLDELPSLSCAVLCSLHSCCILFYLVCL